MKTQRAKEGYLLVENRHAPFMPGVHPMFCQPVFEAPTYTCSHCCAVVVINPDRVRARAYCPKCDHNICDACESVRLISGGTCTTFKEIMDRAAERVLKGEPDVQA